MSGKQHHLVLITGATGHVGFAVLKEALKQGYRVRAAVRSQEKADHVRKNSIIESMQDIDLSFIIIPDFLAPNAFDEALAGDVTFVIHVASPIPQAEADSKGVDLGDSFVKPTAGMSLNLLEAARNAPVVKRIVITSSAAAIVPLTAWTTASKEAYNPDFRLAEISPPYPNASVAYIAAQVAALGRAEAWMRRERPHFDLIHIHPSFILGRDDYCTTTQGFFSGTNRFALNGALGLEDAQMDTRPGLWTSVKDAAYVHVSALKPEVQGNQSFVVSNPGTNIDGFQWDVANEIVARRFPEEVRSGLFPNTGRCGTVGGEIDIRKTEGSFKFRHASFEEVFVEVVEHYLTVLGVEKQK